MKIYAALSCTLLSTANAAFSILGTKPSTVTGIHGKPASTHAEDLALTISLSLAHFSALDAAMTEELTEEIETVLKNAKETVEKCERMIQSIEEDMVVVEEPVSVVVSKLAEVSKVDVSVAEEKEEIVIVAIEEETVAVVEDEPEPVVEDVVAEETIVVEEPEIEPEPEPVLIVVPVPEPIVVPASVSVPAVATNAPKMEVKPRTRRHVQIQSTPNSKESRKMRLFSITNGSSSSSSTKINSVVKVSPGYSYVSTPTFHEKDYRSKTGKAIAGMSRFVKLFSAFGLRR
jgi:hypothetical protein